MNSETTKWPQYLTSADVVTVDPETGQRGEWPVTGHPTHANGCVIVTCDLPDGGEHVLLYQPTQRATVRAHATYKVEPLLTDPERDRALHDLTPVECAFIAGSLRQGYEAVFDHMIANLGQTKLRQAAEDERRTA